MLGFKVTNLKTDRDKNIFYNKAKIKALKKEIEKLLKQLHDIDVTEELISSLEFERGKDKNNLTAGYHYILGNKPINKDTIKELYDILSQDLLDEYSVENMGEYYRQKDVYVFDGSPSIFPFYRKAIDAEKVEDKMNSLFEYINKDNEKDIIETYIKSQIMHYYIILIHPYFDVNGRLARTLSMWYQLKQNTPELILFNNGVYKNRDDYKKSILKCNRGDITPFIEYSLKILKEEIEERLMKEKNSGEINKK